MSTFIYDSLSNSRTALEQRMQRFILPMLEELLDAEVEKKVTIDSNLNMQINGTFVGKADKMCNFAIETGCLAFNYGNKRRYVNFGIKGFEPCYRVVQVYETAIGGSGSFAKINPSLPAINKKGSVL